LRVFVKLKKSFRVRIVALETNSVNYITLCFGVKVVEGVFGYKKGKIFSGLTAEHVNCQRLSRKEDQTYYITRNKTYTKNCEHTRKTLLEVLLGKQISPIIKTTSFTNRIGEIYSRK
jgi:hypothetical protein